MKDDIYNLYILPKRLYSFSLYFENICLLFSYTFSYYIKNWSLWIRKALWECWENWTGCAVLAGGACGGPTWWDWGGWGRRRCCGGGMSWPAPAPSSHCGIHCLTAILASPPRRSDPQPTQQNMKKKQYTQLFSLFSKIRKEKKIYLFHPKNENAETFFRSWSVQCWRICKTRIFVRHPLADLDPSSAWPPTGTKNPSSVSAGLIHKQQEHSLQSHNRHHDRTAKFHRISGTNNAKISLYWSQC